MPSTTTLLLFPKIAMQEQIEQRLQQLKIEFESGQKMLVDLESQQANLKTTMLRISGAIQVLEELIAQPEEINIDDNNHMREDREVLTCSS